MKGIIDMSATTVIKDILETKNKSQVELAEEINITRQNLSNKMNRDKFSALELVEIADALDMNLILRDKDFEQVISRYKIELVENGKSDNEIKKCISNLREFCNWIVDNKQEFVIDYPDELKGKSKRNMTEEEKKAAQEKSMLTKAKNGTIKKGT